MPLHPPNEGVIAYVTVPGEEFIVEIVCMGMVLVPEGVNPETPAVAVAVHEKVAAAGLEVKLTKAVVEPEQMVWFKGVLVKTGTLLMIKDFVAVMDGPHSFVTINDTV